ncbi:phage tail tape measure protein [Candidatus Termititenax aidoneus]|uniref:Phage tail tape measure protein n=1 Tax=Termititenax aidoneus TaxID=2218524 RepID=A0A388TBS9_TERA1|nr:phage tail tape measure protein [Candidatus Termititenax aidoneus]
MAENHEDIILNAVDNATRQIKNVADSLENLGKKAEKPINKLGSFMANLNAIKIGAQAVWNGVKNLISAFQEQEKASAKLTQALKNQGIQSEKTQKEIEAYSSEIQKASLYGDEMVTSVQAGLVAMGLQGDELKRVTQATVDFAAATGQDLVSAGKLLEKAVGGNISALSRYGISANDLSGALAQLEGRYGGMAQAIANTPTGKLVQLGNSFGDLKETVGDALVNAIAPLVSGFVNLFSAINNGGPIIKAIVAGIGVMIGAFTVGIPIVTAFGVTLSAALWPLTLIALGVAGLTVLFATINSNTDLSKKSIAELNKELDETNRKIEQAEAKASKGGHAGQGAKNQLANLEAYKKDIQEFIKIEQNKTYISSAEGKRRAEITEFYSKENEKIQKDSLNQQRTLQEEFLSGEINQREYQAQLDYEAAETRMELLQNEYMQKFELENLSQEQMLALQQNYATQRAAIQDQMNAAELAANTSSIKGFINMIDIKKSKNKELAQDFSTWSAFMVQAQSSDNKTLSAIGKALAIYDITNKTAEAAMAGFSAMSGVPIVGPALGVAAAAAAIAFGAEQIAKVNSNQLALAEGGSFIASQPTRGNLGGQDILFGEAGPEAVTFQPLADQPADGGEPRPCYIVIREPDQLVEALYYTEKDWLHRSGLS